METNKTPKPLFLTDPTTGRTWEIPRQRVTSIFADVEERWVANVIVPYETVRRLVPADFLEPIPTEAGYILSLCAIFMRHAAPDWAPLNIGPGSRNCALRVACIDTRDDTQAVWVDHRYSDSILVEALAKLGFPQVHATLETKMDENRVQMETKDGAIKLDLHHTDLPTPPPRAFENTEAFETYFTAGVRSYGPGLKPGTATIVDLYKRSDNHFEALPRFEGMLKTPLGEWPVDGLYKTINGIYEWRYEGDAVLENEKAA